jgi:hypothetical protein
MASNAGLLMPNAFADEAAPCQPPSEGYLIATVSISLAVWWVLIYSVVQTLCGG